jgi:FlaG/FlaF family flagellin (archaellin)
VRTRRFAGDERAVSPIIGTILVLFIVLLAMAGILVWGVPAIQGLQDHAEFQSMLTQVHQLDAELLTLRDAGTTRPITMSMNQGTLKVLDGSRWVVLATADAAYSPVYFTKWEGDTGLLAKSLPVVATNVTVDKAVGGTFTRLRAVNCNTGGDCETGLAANQLKGNTIRVQFKSATLVKAEAWIFDAGRITYDMDGNSKIHIEMGAIFTEQVSRIYVEAKPSIKEPLYTVTPMDSSYLVRAFQLDGDTSASGKGRHSVYAYLDNNYGTTRGRPLISPAYTVRLQIDDAGATSAKGPLEEGFCNYFLTQSYYTAASACNGGSVSLLYDPPDGAGTNSGKMSYELNQAVVRVTVQAF